MSAANLAAYVSPDAPLPSSTQAFAASCWDQAAALIAHHIGGTLVGAPESALTEDPDHPGFWGIDPEGGTPGNAAVVSPLPLPIVNRAILEVGAELFHRRQAPSGISQFATPDGSSAVRVARDPMIAARDMLAPFVGRGVA